jgi:hypothetical protein
MFRHHQIYFPKLYHDIFNLNLDRRNIHLVQYVLLKVRIKTDVWYSHSHYARKKKTVGLLISLMKILLAPANDQESNQLTI